jgi:predicted RND superfamily exporter protein
VRGAGELVEDAGRSASRALGRPARWGAGAALGAALRRPGRVLAVGLAVAAVGWAVDSRTEVVSDVERLVPQDLQAVQDLKALQRATGVAGEIDVVVEGRDLTDPKVVTWMRDYQAGLLGRYGYSSERGCGRAELCPALSLPDLFRSSQSASDRERIRGLLDAVPPYFSRAVITADRKTANLAFGIRLASLERQQQIVDEMRRRLDPPAGVTARLAGLPVLAAEANATLSDPLRLLSARFEAERAAGREPPEALRRMYRSTGAAVLASGATAIAGFAVLALSDVRMLRDFGLVTVVDLTVSLLGVLAVLPAVLMLAERRAAVRRSAERAPAPAVPA